MKFLKIVSLVIILNTLNIAVAQNYTPVDNGSSVTFAIKNFGFTVDGTFKNLQGNIVFDANQLGVSSFNITVSSATVDTKNKTRDNHLKKEEYFDVAKYPTIVFVSEKIEKVTVANTYKVTGKFTIKNKSKQVEFNFTAIPNSTGMQFMGNININRRDFAIGGSSLVLADNLIVSLTVFAKKITS